MRLPSSFLLVIANLTDVGSSLLRGIALAHLLSPEQFGIAITVSVVANIVELVTDIGIAPLAVRAENPLQLRTLHAISVSRATIIGTIIILCGPLFAWLFHSAGAVLAYVIVGCSSIIRGFANLEVEARTRQYDYMPKVIALILAQTGWTAVSIAYAYYFHDFLAMAVGILCFMIIYVAVSHLLSTHRWRLAWDQDVVQEALRYGRPLALNGVATALASLGDRVLTGAKVGLTQLAHYTALTNSALLPRAALARYLGSVFTPHFVNARDMPTRVHVAHVWTLIITVIGGTFGLGFTAFGQPVTEFVYGRNYEVPQALVGMVGLLGTIRYMSCIATPPILAYGRNEILVRYTLLSLSGLALGAALLTVYRDLEFLLLGMCVGELGALFWLLSRLTLVIPVARVFLYNTIMIPLGLVVATLAATIVTAEGHGGFKYPICLVSFCVFALLVWIFLRKAGCSIGELVFALIPRHAAQARVQGHAESFPQPVKAER